MLLGVDVMVDTMILFLETKSLNSTSNITFSCLIVVGVVIAKVPGDYAQIH